MQKEKQFDYGIEILRILLMVFIVVHHCIAHEIGFSSLQQNEWAGNQSEAYAICNAFLIVAVNVFFLISGYFGVTRNMKKAKSLHAECIFYAVISAAATKIFGGGWSTRYLIRALVFPEIFYWFVFVYIIILLVSPYLSYIIERLDRKEYRILLVVSFIVIVIFDFYYGYSALGYTKGYSLLNGIFFYFIGAYINIFELEKYLNRVVAAVLYFIICLLNGGIAAFLINIGKQERAWNMYAYSNPLVITASILLFNSFVGLTSNVYYQKVRTFSNGILAVYLFTEYWPMREYIYKPINIGNSEYVILYAFLWGIILTFLISFLDNIRKRLWRYFMTIIGAIK